MRSDTGLTGARRWNATHLECLVWFALFGAFLWRFWTLERAVPTARIYHDTEFYFSCAKDNGYFSTGLWGGERCALPLLVFKWFQTDPERIRRFFLLSSALSWVLLAIAVAHSTTLRSVRMLGLFLVLSLAVSRDVWQWNAAILSESLSFSSGAVLAACTLFFLRQPRVWLAPLLLSAAVYALCRDSNAYLILCAGALWLLAAWRGRQRPIDVRRVVLGLWFIALFLGCNASSNQGGRWQYPLTNVFVSRLLPDPIAREKLVALGMPPLDYAARSALRRRAADSERLKPFNEWLETSGKSAYQRYLLQNPSYFLGAPLGDISALLAENLGHYAPKGIQTVGGWQGELLWARSAWWLRLAALPVLAVLVLARRKTAFSPLAIVGLTLTALAYPHALVVWHGDFMEVGRHGVQVAFQLELALLCLLLAASEAALSFRRSAK